MINQTLLLSNVGLFVLAVFLLHAYQRRYGQSYWQIFLTGRSEAEKIMLVHTALNQLGLGDADKRILQTLKQKGCKSFLGFRLSALDNSYLIMTECPDKHAWITVFYLNNQHYLAITGIAKAGEKKIITISNASKTPGKVQGQFIRFNHGKYTVDVLFARLDKLSPQRQRISLKSYMKLSKKLFLDELLSASQTHKAHKQLEIPGRYVQPHRELITQYAEKYHINEHFLAKNNHKILIVNSHSSPDYLVANLVTASAALYSKRKIMTASLKAAENVNEWFASQNNRIAKENKFHYLGTIEDELKTDFYFHQDITVRYKSTPYQKIKLVS